MKKIDEAGLADVLKSHRGKVVLVDYWATWCPPCMKVFPHTVELHRKLAKKGLVVISVSLDDEDEEAKTRSFLTKEGATFENFISRYGAGTESVDAFDIPDGAIPYYQLYDRTGTLARQLTPPVEPEQIDKAVEELLSTP